MKNKQTKKTKTEVKAVSSLKKSFRAFNWHRAGMLALYTLIAIVVYYYLNIVYGQYSAYTVGAYVLVSAAMIVAYFAYNRAFTGRGVTYEMLPDTMTDKEKREYLDDVAEREKRSRWMLMIIFPLITTLMIDMLKLFVIDRYFDFKLF